MRKTVSRLSRHSKADWWTACSNSYSMLTCVLWVW